MKDISFVQDFVERIQDYLGSFETDLLGLEDDPSSVIGQLLRSTVSIETEAQMFGVIPIEYISHYLTKYLKIIREYSLKPDIELITLLLKLYDSIEYALQELSYTWDLKTVENEIKKQIRPTLHTLESHISILITPTEYFSEIEQIFPLKSAAHLAAAEYGKKVEIEIIGEKTLIPQLLLKRLPRLLTHLLNNAITHGIEMPEVRQKLGKPMAGKLILKAESQDKQTIISFSDDGAGIDIERVKNKAITKQLITPLEASHLSNTEVYEFLFHPNFTTKDIRDLRAGTGYGLDVVRVELQKLGGSISIESKLNQGTKFTIIYYS